MFPEWIVDLGYLLVGVISAPVALLAWLQTVRMTRGGEAGTPAWFLMVGIALAWTGDGIVRVWFAVWRQIGQPDWMVSHEIVALALASLTVGGLIHLRALTHAKLSERGWVLFFALALLMVTLYRALFWPSG